MPERIQEIAIPADNIFANDVLGRRRIVKFLAALIDRTKGPFAMAIESPWGQGKTTLIRMLEKQLLKENHACVYFNAWEIDYTNDPLVAIVASLSNVQCAEGPLPASFAERLKSLGSLTSLIVRRAAVVAAKIATVGALDIDKEVEKIAADGVGSATDDVVSLFQEEKKLLDKFREVAATTFKLAQEEGKKSNIVIFVDELDRCRPTFAIELLERIKHLFNVPNVLFVFSIDKRQLEASICAVYGSAFDASEYLRRFFDLEYSIPPGSPKAFVSNLVGKLGLTTTFERRSKYSELRYDQSNFVDYFSALAKAASLSLRAQERCLTRLQVLLEQLPDDNYLHPIIAAFLILIRLQDPELFRGLQNGNFGRNEAMQFLGSLPGSKELFDKRDGWLIDAYLIAGDDNEERRRALTKRFEAIGSGAEVDPNISQRYAAEVVSIIPHITGHFKGDPRIPVVAAMVDLAHGIRE